MTAHTTTAGLAPVVEAIDSWPAALVAIVALILFVGPQGFAAWNAWRARADTRVVREHTENSHADAEHPNLRDELTAARVAAEAAAKQSAAAAEASQKAVSIAQATDTRLTEHIAHADQADDRRDHWQLAVERDLQRLNRPLFAWRR
jgi:hypothetical protein